MTLLSVLQEAVRNASSSNPHAESAPACVLWPDAARSFEALLPQLMAALPELYVLGEYAPDERRGPAIWLRYQLDGGKLDGLGAGTPIFYLPRISRQDLRPEADCPFLLAPLCELMFRGKVWAHENGKDWTPAAFLISRDIELAGDSETRKALQDTLPTLMKMDVVEIAGQGQLNAPVLHELLHPEPVESLLAWLNDPKGWKASQTREQWTAFAATCKTKFDFEPAKEGELGGAERLGGRINNWSRVWRAFERAPERFPGVVDLLVKVRVRPKDLFTEESSWPQINRDKEESLRLVLLSLADTTPEDARASVREMEALHGERRNWVWARLRQSPLARALAPLTRLAAGTEVPLGGRTPEEMATQWTTAGWETDAALLDALASVESAQDVAAVSGAARTLYLDWLSQGATRFGHLVAATPLRSAPGFPAPAPSVCYVFADGLRYDVARRMVNELGAAGLRAECNWRFGPLPGVTNTAKPAVSPLDDAVFAAGTGLAARFADGRLVTADSLRNELKKSGLAILNGLETGDPSAGPAWTECGAFDSKGHALGAGLAGQLGPEIGVLVGRIRSLLEAGWKEIRLTTDHGWVLLPGNLEKAHLPEHLTEVRKGRCARLKTGATTEFQTVPWHWDPAVSIAIAPGARCFEEGKAYEHGGLSVQECVLPLVTVRSAAAAASAGRLGEFVWKGFRLVVPVTAASAGSRIDLRTKAGDAGSSLCGGGKAVTGESVALVVEDEHRGAAAHLVLLDATGAVVDKVNASVPDD